MKLCLENLRPGDTLVVWRLDRLGRSLKDLIEIIGSLDERGISFRSIQDAINTATTTGKFFFHVTGAFAELERNLIRERTMAGLKAARARGKNGGRPKSIPDSKFELAKRLYDEGNMTVAEICKQLGFSRSRFYQYLKSVDRSVD
jgi:DNA invertase Pin-like site-specific DNA recombinase